MYKTVKINRSKPRPLVALTTAMEIFVIIATGLLLCSPAMAQNAMESMMQPHTVGKAQWSLDYNQSGFLRSDTTGRKRMGWLESSFAISKTIVTEADDYDVSLGLSFDRMQMDTNAILPDTNEKFPDELFDLGISLTARKKTESGLIGFSAGISSASDRPMNSMDEVSYNASAFWLYQYSPTSSWLYMLYYDSNFGIPLPGAAWMYRPSKTFALTLGFPFSMVYYRPWERLDLTATAAPYNGMARLRYWITKELAIFGAYDIGGKSFAIHDRINSDDRLSYFGNRAYGGASWDITKNISLTAKLGWGFDRFWYEGEDFASDRHDNRIDLDDGLFAELNLSLKF